MKFWILLNRLKAQNKKRWNIPVNIPIHGLQVLYWEDLTFNIILIS